jgi:hypothetical protein
MDMDRVRYEQLREILALQIMPELREIKRRQTVLRWGVVFTVSGLVVVWVLIGALFNVAT